MPSPPAGSPKINWKRRATLVLMAPLLAPLLVLGLLAIGVGSLLLLLVEWGTGGRQPRTRIASPTYDPAFEKLGQRPAI